MEFSLIERIRVATAVARDDVALGIGDDGAVLRARGDRELVVVVDTMVEGVHFPRGTDAASIGWKSLAVNLSDLAAMGAEPSHALLALTLPDADEAWVDAYAHGFAKLAREHRVALVGGDTTRGPLAITVTAFGHVEPGRALRRDGARVGDLVCVSGTLGDAAAGLQQPSIEPLRARLDRPTPRIALGRALVDRASACIDVSDGLLADLAHVCDASGVGAVLDVDALPASDALRAAVDRATMRQLQLSGGDDYELCFTIPREALAAFDVRGACTVIGEIVAGAGITVKNRDGDVLDVGRRGYEHFGVSR